MKSFAILSLAAAAVAMPQAASPEGCSSSADGSFQITTVNVTSDATKRDLQRRQLSGVLTLSLEDGILKDQAGRTGYVASNYQFQFDAPVQAGARETSGFGLCSNNSLSLGGTTVWYQCLSGDFYNLYSQSTGAQCIPIHIVAVNEGSASQLPDGQPQAPTGVSQISDGQPQATAPAPAISQISDGQPQASAPAVISQISDGQPQASAPAVITQISDGQPQASAPAVVSQISDGQPQASAPVANATVSRPALPEFTGAAATSTVAAGALVAGLFGLFALL